MNGAVYQAFGRVTADALRDGALGATGGQWRPTRLCAGQQLGTLRLTRRAGPEDVDGVAQRVRSRCCRATMRRQLPLSEGL